MKSRAGLSLVPAAYVPVPNEPQTPRRKIGYNGYSAGVGLLE
jgi:hypothetical protein